MNLHIQPIRLDQAVGILLMHQRPVPTRQQFIAAVAVADDSAIVGVGCLAEPRLGKHQTGFIAEILPIWSSVAEGEFPILDSLRQAGLILGFQRILTYSTPDTNGPALQDAGFSQIRTIEGDVIQWASTKEVNGIQAAPILHHVPDDPGQGLLFES